MDFWKADFEKKRQFLLRNEGYFIRSVSTLFGFNSEQLKKYGPILEKEFLGVNQAIKWDIDLIAAVIQLPGDNDDFFCELSYNESLPWGFDLIEHFKDKWHWETMACNDVVVTNGTLRNYYFKQLGPHLDGFWEGATNRLLGLYGDGQTIGEACETQYCSVPYYQQRNELQFLDTKEIEQYKEKDWRMLSYNTLLPWSAELIERYQDKWDWPVLCANKCVPWDLELMKKFEDHIDWTIGTPDENGMTSYDGLGISENLYLEWDKEILETFSHKLDPWCISMSIAAKWDIDLLIQFESFWDIHGLGMNTKVWAMVFPEFEKGDIICGLLDMIIERRKLLE